MDDNDYYQFVEKFYQKTSIPLQLYKEKQMRRRLTSFITQKGYSTFLSFYDKLLEDETLLHQVLDRITINVSEFFRNPNRWEVLEKEILPALLEENKHLSCWSTACSTGEEPYTLYMILKDLVPSGHFSILATDIDDLVLAHAKAGIYTQKGVEFVPREKLARYMSFDGPTYQVVSEAKNKIRFEKQNLLSDTFDGTFDLIICRNVMIYFNDEAKAAIYHRFSRALKPNGILFVGSTEQIFQAHTFDLEAVRPFFYRKITNE